MLRYGIFFCFLLVQEDFGIPDNDFKFYCFAYDIVNIEKYYFEADSTNIMVYKSGDVTFHFVHRDTVCLKMKIIQN